VTDDDNEFTDELSEI